jgi:hypothetical protein
MVSADRMLDRGDAQMGRGEWRCPVRERGGSLVVGSDGSATDCGEGVSPNNWANFRDFLTRSARSWGHRLFVVGGRSRSRWCRGPDKPGVSRGHVSTAVTGAEVEVERAWDDDRTYLGLAVVLGKGDFPRAG